MPTNIRKKLLVLGIFIMFICISVIPDIGANFRKPNNIFNADFTKNTWRGEELSKYPPNEEWNNTFGGTDVDIGSSVQQTSDGGYIITGWTLSYGAGSNDVWLIKTDANGTKEWNQTFGGTSNDYGYCIQQTADGGYIITGATDSFGAGGDVWLIKADNTGNEVWNRTFGGIGVEIGYYGQKIADGGYIITGYTSSYGAGSNDVWLVKTDANGTEEWNQTFGGINYDYGFFVQQTTDGGYIITGNTDSYGAGHTDVWLVKTDANGTEEWNQTFGESMWDFGRSIQQIADGGYIIVGWTWTYDAGVYDVWLIRTDPDGNLEWDKKFGGNNADDGYFVQQISDGGYIITGDTWSYGAGSNDVWLVKTDANGTEEWNQTFGGTDSEYGFSVQQTTDEGFIIAGITYSYGAGSSDFWLIKIEKENNFPYEPTNPYPENNSWNVDIETNLSWTGGDPDGDNLTYDVYFEANDSTPDVLVSENQTETTYDPRTMNYSTRYYWKIVAWDNHEASTEGPVWDFTTRSDSNHPPNKPNIYYENITLFAYATDIDDDDVMYFIDWGDGTINETGYYPSGETVEINHTYSGPGVYYILVQAKDIHGAESKWSDPYEIIIENNPPQTPDIVGPSSGVAGISYNFTFNSVDPDGDNVYYYILWGDGYVENWIGPFSSGVDFDITHTYVNKRTYLIEAKARDIYGDEGLIATHEINIPRTRVSNNPLFLRLLECFPILERLLNLLK